MEYLLDPEEVGSYERVWFKKGSTPPYKGKKLPKSIREKIRTASLADGRVPYLKNGVHHLKGKRGAETPNWKGGITPERQAFYGSLEWKKVAKEVWKRDKATCQRCRKYHNTKENRGTFDIHHIVGFENVSLRMKLSNLVLLCEKCHYFVHSKKKNKKKEFIK